MGLRPGLVIAAVAATSAVLAVGGTVLALTPVDRPGVVQDVQPIEVVPGTLAPPPAPDVPAPAPVAPAPPSDLDDDDDDDDDGDDDGDDG